MYTKSSLFRVGPEATIWQTGGISFRLSARKCFNFVLKWNLRMFLALFSIEFNSKPDKKFTRLSTVKVDSDQNPKSQEENFFC